LTKLPAETDPAPELSVVTGKGPSGLLTPPSVPKPKTWYCVFGAKWDRDHVMLQKLGLEVGLNEIDTVGWIGTIVPPCAPWLTHAPWFLNCVPSERCVAGREVR
jgi:hypothetical protein